MAPIPSGWKGTCDNGSDPTFRCNRKLIGARYFNKGYAADVGQLNISDNSPRDYNGHGTHTLSTAAGSIVHGASVLGLGNGTAKGGSPRARVAAYKACWPVGCYDADVLAAFDMAIHDGVQVLSVSLGGKHLIPFLEDAVAIGSFHAVSRGIVVVCSAGNSGPAPGTVRNNAPWQISVGASTIDRQFRSDVILAGSKLQFMGESLSDKSLPEKNFCNIIYAKDASASNASATDAELCLEGSLDGAKVQGKILVCRIGTNWNVEKGRQALLAGAVGMVVVNDKNSGHDIAAEAHVLPATQLSYEDGIALLSIMSNTSYLRATITKPTTRLGIKSAPVIATFSSRGPNPILPEILKPDITAPGVSIIAAVPELVGPSGFDFDTRRVKFNTMTGTSMSCPHVAGVAGLVKSVHPFWSPAAIRSAIMTTATVCDKTLKSIINMDHSVGTPFSYGAGHIDPNRVADPGLVYDLNTTDYLNLLCAMGYTQDEIQKLWGISNMYICPTLNISFTDFNYPSITINNLNGSSIVTRKVKNVGSLGTYTANVTSPPGILVQINPETLEFKSIGEEKTFEVIIQAEEHGARQDYVFGQLIWSGDQQHYVRSSIVVKY